MTLKEEILGLLIQEWGLEKCQEHRTRETGPGDMPSDRDPGGWDEVEQDRTCTKSWVQFLGMNTHNTHTHTLSPTPFTLPHTLHILPQTPHTTYNTHTPHILCNICMYRIYTFLGVSIAVKRDHDHGNSCKRKHLIGVNLQCQRFSPLS